MVAPGQSTPMPSPIPREVRWNERFMPSPNERSSTMDSVPQAMAMTVRPMRLRLRAASTRKRRQTRSSSVGLMGQASFRATTGSSCEARRAGK